MRRALLVASLAVLLPAAGAAAQAHPDFSGTWKIDTARSDAPPGRRGQQMDMSGLVLAITQSAEVLTIRQTGMGPDRTMTFYLDGRKSTNAGPRGEMTSTSTWKGTELVTDGTMQADTPRGPMTMTMHEVRRLGQDGTEMTVTTTNDTPRGTMTRTMVFVRQ